MASRTKRIDEKLVYKISSPSGKCYIGKTTKGLEKRRYQHVYCAINKNTNTPLSRAIRKYGDLLKWEVLETYDNVNELRDGEIFHIKANKAYENG